MLLGEYIFNDFPSSYYLFPPLKKQQQKTMTL